MRSWQRRMAAADRRFSFHAATTDQPAPDTEPAEMSGPIESSTLTLTAATTGPPQPTAPSAATQLAALLRAERTAGDAPAVLLVGTA